MSRKWYRRIMIIFSIFMIGLLLLQLVAGLLRPASRTGQPQPTPVGVLVTPGAPAHSAVTSSRAEADSAPAPEGKLGALDDLLQVALSLWRPAWIGSS